MIVSAIESRNRRAEGKEKMEEEARPTSWEMEQMERMIPAAR